jgi:hypothetical protein
MYEKELKELEARVAALTVDSEKESGTKKIKTVKRDIIILAQIKEGTDHHARMLKKVGAALSWVPGQKSTGGISTYKNKVETAFGTDAKEGKIRYEKVYSFYSDSDSETDWAKLEEQLSKIGGGFSFIPGKDFFRPSNNNLSADGKWGKILRLDGHTLTLLSTDYPIE